MKVTHPGGVREVEAVEVQSRSRSYARGTIESRVGIGSGAETPSSFSVRMTLTGVDLRAASDLAYTIIEEAQAASKVETHRGEVSVDKLQSHDMRGREDTVQLTLTWRVVRSVLKALSWDNTEVTWDSDEVTWDAERVPR